MPRLAVALVAVGALFGLSACRTSLPPAAASPSASAPTAASSAPVAGAPTTLERSRWVPRLVEDDGRPVDRVDVEAGVRAVLEAQVREWNAGSLRGFMAGYVEADSIVFLSGSNVRRGWEEALYAYYRSYPDADAMGLLSFNEVTVEPITNNYALVWGRWHLLVDGPLDAQPEGLFTLLFVRTDQGWRIIHDHTS